MVTSANIAIRSGQLLLAAGLLFFSTVGFATSTWDFSATATTGSSGCTPTGGAALGNSWSCNSVTGGPTATVTAWAGTDSVNFAAAEVAQYNSSGFGVRNTNSTGIDYSGGSPAQHSMDNNGKTDLLLFYFGGTQVSLDSVKMGWTASDSDFSLLAYTGSGTPDSGAMATKMAAHDTAGTGDGLTTSTVASGWSLVNHYAGVGTTATTVTPYGLNPDGTVKASDTYSSWWIVSAYNGGYGGSSLDSTSDYLKLRTIIGQVKPPSNEAPEPGSMALMGLALAGVLATRRHKRSIAA